MLIFHACGEAELSPFLGSPSTALVHSICYINYLCVAAVITIVCTERQTN